MTSLAAHIEHTCLRADATPKDLARLFHDATTNSLFGVCVAPLYVELAKETLRGTAVRAVTVVGFPLGAMTSRVKAFEAEQAVLEGADEVDMVMAVGLALAGEWRQVEADIRAVRDRNPGTVLKVILETGFFDEAGIRRAAEVAVSAGADFVKTSTGFGPRGATVEDVRVLHEVVAGRAQVKASGGIRTAAQARALLDAGATRIGTSNGVELAQSRSVVGPG